MDALFLLIGGVIGYLITFWTHRENLSVKMVEIALGILAAEPEKTRNLRGWAVKTLARYSEVPLSDDEKNALLEKQLPVYADAVMTSAASSRATFRPRGLGAHSEHGEKFEPPAQP